MSEGQLTFRLGQGSVINRATGQFSPALKKRTISQQNKAYYQRHKTRIKDQVRSYREGNRVKVLLDVARRHAEKKGFPFGLVPADIVVPAVCPVLGIPLLAGGPLWNRPSIDRFDCALGYVPSNIRIISFRANHLKSDGTVEELKKILKYMEGSTGEQSL